jgi:hypothetical protein
MDIEKTNLLVAIQEQKVAAQSNIFPSKYLTRS